jgi:hypothetical protein
MQDTASHVLGILFGLIGVVLALAILGLLIQWCMEDARRRGKSGVMLCLAVILFFPWGLVAWLVFRPEPIDRGGRPRRLRLDDHRLQ